MRQRSTFPSVIARKTSLKVYEIGTTTSSHCWFDICDGTKEGHLYLAALRNTVKVIAGRRLWSPKGLFATTERAYRRFFIWQNRSVYLKWPVIIHRCPLNSNLLLSGCGRSQRIRTTSSLIFKPVGDEIIRLLVTGRPESAALLAKFRTLLCVELMTL